MADLGEGLNPPPSPLLVRYMQKFYKKKMTEISIQSHFMGFCPPPPPSRIL